MTRTMATVPSAAEWRVPTAADQVIPRVERWFVQALAQIESWAETHRAALESLAQRQQLTHHD
jgi:hypothetical protein